MKAFTKAIPALGIVFALVGCESSTSPPAPSIVLSQQQAALLVSRISLAAPLHSDIAWLADSVNLVIAAGAEADLLAITTDLAAGPFYAVGLQRAINAAPSSFSTFHLIAFNDASNPTAFIIIGGYHQASPGAPPPESVSGSFGSPNPSLSVTGHLFQIQGSTVSEWRAATGTATMQNGTASGACANFQPTTGVTCAQSSLMATFTIDVARHDNGSVADTRSASLTSLSEVSGIRLNFQ